MIPNLVVLTLHLERRVNWLDDLVSQVDKMLDLLHGLPRQQDGFIAIRLTRYDGFLHVQAFQRGSQFRVSADGLTVERTAPDFQTNLESTEVWLTVMRQYLHWLQRLAFTDGRPPARDTLTFNKIKTVQEWLKPMQAESRFWAWRQAA